MKRVKKNSISLLILLLILTLCIPGYSQIRSGIPFLKMLPGARLQAMAGSHTGTFDEMYSIYANPAATGFYREWQWAASYNKWIADVFNASLIYGSKIWLPWSRNGRVALGIIYYGVPEFNSSSDVTQNVSANDLIASFGIGQPISLISKNISVGFNLKYYKSSLAEYNTSSTIFDIGLLAKTPEFSLMNSFLEYGIFSVGFSATQLGKNIDFDMVGTPLPQTMRAGAAFYAGSYHGLQLQFSADYIQIKDHDDGISIGTEVSWNNRFALNAGYNFSNDLMDKFSIGVSFRLDDIFISDQSFLPGRNKAIQLDAAMLGESEFFSDTFRGDFKHQPVAPEKFDLLKPAMNDTVKDEHPVLKWEKTKDLDLYDRVTYTLLVDQDSLKLATILSYYDNKETTRFWESLNESIFFIKQTVKQDSFKITDYSSGQYYWAVFAFDKDKHIRFGKQKRNRISRFFVPFPDIDIKEIVFNHSEWITEDDFQGNLSVKLENIGTLPTGEFTVTLYDSIIGSFLILGEKDSTYGHNSKILVENNMKSLAPGEEKTISIPWHSTYLGTHSIMAIADSKKKIKEGNESNNKVEYIFHTIPKGFFVSEDTITGAEVNQIALDMPIITEISFDVNSVEIKPEYLKQAAFDAPMELIAKRLQENPFLKISIKGFADPNSEEKNEALAKGRSVAVRHHLLQLGVKNNQIEILPGEVLPYRKIPPNHLDKEWILEERRHVQIFADGDGRKILFEPIHHVDEEILPKVIKFDTKIKSKVPIHQGWVTCFKNELSEIVPVQNSTNHNNIRKTINWNLETIDNVSKWLNSEISTYITVTDSLGRQFKTREKKFYMNKKIVQFERRLAFPLKFAKMDPSYDFYWAHVYKEVQKMIINPQARFRFAGHACAIGPERINEVLSRQRAKKFHNEFLSFVQNNNPKNYSKIKKHLDPAEGYGEYVPLSINRLDGKRIIVGDNSKPIGRKLNRRIEVVILSNVQSNMVTNVIPPNFKNKYQN